MAEKSTRELESQVAAQEKQISRYESRLKDVVAAYKGLLKEKEALEAALATSPPAAKTSSTTNAVPSSADIDANNTASNSTSRSAPTAPPPSSTPATDLNKQIATLMNSLATLSAEKSRMESSFQADKRQLRSELAARDQHVRDLNDRAKAAATEASLEVEKVKSKLIIERHARDREISDHMAMVKELQKLLSDERHQRENLEMQLSNLKTQFLNVETGTGTGTTDAKSNVDDLRTVLDQLRRKYKDLKAAARSAATAVNNVAASQAAEAAAITMLQQLQSDMDALRQQTHRTVAHEQKRSQMADDRSKQLAAVHEERVVTLEARLAELSATVGNYDRSRQTDQAEIFRLKDRIAQLELTATAEDDSSGSSDSSGLRRLSTSSSSAKRPSLSQTIVAGRHIDELIADVQQLKQLIYIENARAAEPRDLSKLFATGSDHRDCNDLADRLRADLERSRIDAQPLAETVETQKQHIRTLQAKIQVLNRNIDEQEQELKHKSTAHYAELKQERCKWKELVGTMEMDFRAKVGDLEVQLQKQRERSLKMLEEKELEIKAVRQSFEQFMHGGSGTGDATETVAAAAAATTVATATGPRRKISPHQNAVRSMAESSAGATSSASGASTAECHMLHYVHELSRKEVEITALRKAKNAAEASMRQALQDKVTSQQELHDRIGDLEYQCDRLERCKSRESANLEYLKNVVLSFLMVDNPDSRRHMVNAIGAVLQFSPAELKSLAGVSGGNSVGGGSASLGRK